MAPTTASVRLAEQARREQVSISSGFLAEFLALWGLLDLRDLDRSGPLWVRAVMALIELWRTISARSALDSYNRLRRIEIPGADPLPEIRFIDTPSAERAARKAAREAAPSVKRNPAAPRSQVGLVRTPRQVGLVRRSDEQAKLVIDWGKRRGAVQTSLEVLGPINIKSKIKRGETPETAARKALVEVSGAATRHVLEGDREATITAMRNDNRLLGWVRVTDVNPCSFCAMLASRGVTWGPYGKSSFDKSDARFIGGGQFKVHDHCRCTLAPVYSRDVSLPGNSAELRDMWNKHISGKYSGKDALRAWRRFYEQHQREQARPTIGFPKAA